MSNMFTKSLNSFSTRFFAKRDNPIIHNKYILYVILLFAIVDLFILSVENDIVSSIVFFIIGYLISRFNKNMLVIMFLSLTMTNIIKYGANVMKL